MKASIIATALFAIGAIAMPARLNKRATIIEEVTTTQWTTTTVYVDGTGVPAAFGERHSRSRSSNSSSIATPTSSSSVVLPTSTSSQVVVVSTPPAVNTPTSLPVPAVAAAPSTVQAPASQQTQPSTQTTTPVNTGSGPSGSGQLTFYSLGQVSCGQTYSDSDYVVALATATMNNPANPNNNPLCGKTISITYGGKTMTAKVVDTCEGCAAGDVDLSPSLFSALVGSQSLGRVSGATWVVS